MRFVNWHYPEARVIVRFGKGVTFEKIVRRAIGLIIGQTFIGFMTSDAEAARVPEGSADA